MNQYHFVGIDIAKDKFDVAVQKDGKYINKVFLNTRAGIKSFHQWLVKFPMMPWVCMEATGHYGYKLADYLYEQQINISVINPLKIKHYAKAVFMRNKNDILDARIIAQFGEATKPRLYVPKSPEQKELNSLVNVSNTLKMQLVQFTNQLGSIEGNIAKKITKKMIGNIKKEIATIDKKLTELVAQDDEFKEQLELMCSIKGVGKLTAVNVLARVQDIQSFENAKQFAAFIGVSPRQHQSGKSKGKTRMSCLGDAGLRKSLYMAALVAKRHNQTLQPFVKRLQEAGKAPKAIIGAIMRKLAHWIFAVLKHKKPFEVTYA